MVVVVKIVGDTGLRVGQVSENGPVAGFELFGFKARPQAFRLGIVVAFATPAVRELGLGLAQQGLVGVAYILPAPVGMNDEAGGGALSQQCPLQGTGDQGLGHISAYLPVDDELGAHVLKGAQVDPGAAV